MTNDEGVLEFLIASRVAALWQAALDGDPVFDANRLRTEQGGKFFDVIRERFFSEWDGAHALPIPNGYAFHPNGELAPPNLMQRLTAFRVLRDSRLLNYSGVGAGKTLAAILASRAAGAGLTVVVAVNATLDNWAKVVRNAFPDSDVFVKARDPLTLDPTRPTVVVLNYESFQQRWSEEVVRSLISGRPIDCIVLDEVQSVRLRAGAEESRRRQLIRALVDGAAAQNPNLYVLGMSATPVINDLHEAKTLLELVTGQDLSRVPTRPTVANAILYHQLLTRHGIRHRPAYSQSVKTEYPVVDGQDHLPQLRRVQLRDVLGLEQAVLDAKLATIGALLKPGTLIYTTFVTGMLDRLSAAIQAAGLSFGLFTGDDKSGLEPFLRRQVDVLIGSEPIGTGIDGLQTVSNRLIFACLPWTSAHYDQIVGRLHRQGSQFEKIEVFIPLVELRRAGQIWSWDQLRLDRIRFKRTLADAAVDGVIPEGQLPTQEEMQAHSLRALQKWIDQIAGEQDSEIAAV